MKFREISFPLPVSGRAEGIEAPLNKLRGISDC
jgi:hypothetical protein